MTQIKKNLVDLSTQIDDDCSKSTSNWWWLINQKVLQIDDVFKTFTIILKESILFLLFIIYIFKICIIKKIKIKDLEFKYKYMHFLFWCAYINIECIIIYCYIL